MEEAKGTFFAAEMSTYKFLMIVVHFDDCVLGLTPRREAASCAVPFSYDAKQQCLI